MPKLSTLEDEKLTLLRKHYENLVNQKRDTLKNWQKLEAVNKEIKRRIDGDNKVSEHLLQELAQRMTEQHHKEKSMKDSWTHTLRLHAMHSLQKSPAHLSYLLLSAAIVFSICFIVLAIAVMKQLYEPEAIEPTPNNVIINSNLVYSGLNSLPLSSPNPLHFPPLTTIMAEDQVYFHTGDLKQQPFVQINNKSYSGEFINNGSQKIAAFCFNNISFSQKVRLTGNYPLLILSLKDITINSTFKLDGGWAKLVKNYSLPGKGICGGFDGVTASNNGISHRGNGAGGGDANGIYGGPGASHGGLGGNGSYQPKDSLTSAGNLQDNTAATGSPGALYGTTAISNLIAGSSGGTSLKGSSAAGGGAISFSAINNITITEDTFISTNGGNGCNRRGGAGSGGSIVLQARIITINGILLARGGDSTLGGGAGGGGRIALYFRERINGTIPNHLLSTAGGAGYYEFSNAKKGSVWFSMFGHWQFENSKKLLIRDLTTDSKTIKILPDSCGLGHHLSWSGNGKIPFCKGHYKKALKLNGKDEYLKIDNSTLNSLGKDNFTISFWFKPENTKPNTVILNKGCSTADWASTFMNDENINNARMHFYKGFSNYIFQVDTQDKVMQLKIAESKIISEKWQNITIVKDSTNNTISIYLNGDLISSKQSPARNIQNNNPLYIGCSEEKGVTQFAQFAIDDLRIYNLALQSKDIKKLNDDTRTSQ